MRIEHIAMYVNDLEAARDFFVNYLGGTSNDGLWLNSLCCCRGWNCCGGNKRENG